MGFYWVADGYGGRGAACHVTAMRSAPEELGLTNARRPDSGTGCENGVQGRVALPRSEWEEGLERGNIPYALTWLAPADQARAVCRMRWRGVSYGWRGRCWRARTGLLSGN